MHRLKRAAKRVVGRTVPLLPDAVVSRLVAPGERYDPRAIPEIPPPPSTELRLFIGPANMAGQGWQWARAAELAADVGATSMAAPKRLGFNFPVDVRVPYYAYRWSPRWNRALARSVTRDYSHVLIESARPLFGDALGRSWLEDIDRLRNAGVVVGVVFHGSDIRLPSRHAQHSPWSPFHGPMDGLTAQLEATVAQVHADLAGLDVPVFVSTPDLLIDLPEAQWLPVVVDPERWASNSPPFSLDRVPVVAHAPSRAPLKGSDIIDPILRRLEDEGVVQYVRVEGVAAAEMPAIYGSADIIVDQLTLGIYGVAACEAMAAGRVVVSHVSDQVRDHVRGLTGTDLPIVEANPDTLEDVIRDLVQRTAMSGEIALDGPDFVRAVHDGRVSSKTLTEFVRGDA